jgi:hypothetical protein
MAITFAGVAGFESAKRWSLTDLAVGAQTRSVGVAPAKETPSAPSKV